MMMQSLIIKHVLPINLSTELKEACLAQLQQLRSDRSDKKLSQDIAIWLRKNHPTEDERSVATILEDLANKGADKFLEGIDLWNQEQVRVLKNELNLTEFLSQKEKTILGYALAVKENRQKGCEMYLQSAADLGIAHACYKYAKQLEKENEKLKNEELVYKAQSYWQQSVKQNYFPALIDNLEGCIPQLLTRNSRQDAEQDPEQNSNNQDVKSDPQQKINANISALLKRVEEEKLESCAQYKEAVAILYNLKGLLLSKQNNEREAVDWWRKATNLGDNAYAISVFLQDLQDAELMEDSVDRVSAYSQAKQQWFSKIDSKKCDFYQ